MTARREVADAIARALADGCAIPYWLVRFRTPAERHAYARAWYLWRNHSAWLEGKRPPLPAELAAPDLSEWWPDASGGSRAIMREHASPLTWDNARTWGTAIFSPTPSDQAKHQSSGENVGVALPPSPLRLPPTAAHGLDPAEAASVMANVIRIVTAVGGREDMPVEDWARCCGLAPQIMTRLLSAEAAEYGLAIRRHKGTHGVRLIELTRLDADLAPDLDDLDPADAALDELDVLDRINHVLDD